MNELSFVFRLHQRSALFFVLIFSKKGEESEKKKRGERKEAVFITCFG
jgi:hypothetical protein